jgi:hypothetical protein
VCRSGFRSSSWWSAPRRWSSQLTPRTTAAQRTQSASWLSARPNRVTARRLFCFASLVIVLVRGRQRRGKERSAAAPQLGRNQRNEANFVDVSPGYDCRGVGGYIASPAGASQGRTRQGLALRTMEGTTGQHSERVIEPLWFYRSHAEHTGLANEPKPLSHLIGVRNKIYGQPGNCNVVGFESRGVAQIYPES